MRSGDVVRHQPTGETWTLPWPDYRGSVCRSQLAALAEGEGPG